MSYQEKELEVKKRFEKWFDARKNLIGYNSVNKCWILGGYNIYITDDPWDDIEVTHAPSGSTLWFSRRRYTTLSAIMDEEVRKIENLHNTQIHMEQLSKFESGLPKEV